MNKEFLNQCLNLLQRVGEAKSITLFGSYGIFINGNLIGKVIHDDFYVKANDELISFFLDSGISPYCYYKCNGHVVTNYYPVDVDDTKCFFELIHKVIISCENEKLVISKKVTRFKDLPNLRLSTEKLLLKAGINDVDKLMLVGSVSACLTIHQVHNIEINEQFLLSIEGAIRGVHWSTLTQDIRSELWLEYVDARSCIEVVLRCSDCVE